MSQTDPLPAETGPLPAGGPLPDDGPPAGSRARRLADEAEILGAVHRYCRGVDRADAELTRSAYHADATDDHGSFRGPAHEFADRVNASHASRWSSTMHVVSNHTAVVDGDAADAETYVIAYLRRIDGDFVDVVGGRYLDRFERRQGQWRIARRVYVCEWSVALPVGQPLIDAGAYVPGRRDRSDPSYTLSLDNTRSLDNTLSLEHPGARADG